MRKNFTIGFLLIFLNSALSQNTDSLRHLLYFRQKQEKADLLLTLSKAYWFTKSDTALFYASQALQFSKNIFYKRGIAEAYRHMGVINMFEARAQIAEQYLDTALKKFQNLQDTAGMAATFNNKGVLLSRYLGRYQESGLAFEQALSLFQKSGNIEGTGSVINYMGLNYEAQGIFQKAIDYTLQGLEIRKKIADIPGVMFSLTRVGYLYQTLGQIETALKYYTEALHFAREKKAEPLSEIYAGMAHAYIDLRRYEEAEKYINLALNKDGPGKYYLLLGRFYMETGFPEKALSIYEQAMIRFQKGPDYPLLANSAIGISKVYQLKKDYPAAMKYAKKAYKIASEHNIRGIIADAANSLSSLYSIRRNYRLAYTYEKIHRSISDSINIGDSHRRLAFLESKNEIEKKQSRIELLNKENQIKEQRLKREALFKKFSIGGIAVILLITFVLFRNIILKRKNEKHRRELVENELKIQKLSSERTKAELQQQKTELEMQALRAQMNPHFIFNSLNSINGFILKNQRTEAAEYLTKFSRLIRMILHSSANATVSLTQELAALQLYMELESLRFEQKFDFKIECEPDLDTDFIQVPPMLLQPYIENAIWHGLMLKKDKGNLWVNISQDESVLICTVTDNGIGRKKAAEFKTMLANEHKSMGMGITAHRIALLHLQQQQETSIQINDLVFPDGNPGGTEVVIKIPVTYD